MNQDKWIPVWRELPPEPEDEYDDREEYIVTIMGASYSTTLYYDGAGVWNDVNGVLYSVIAWQPLPEAYHVN